MILNINGHQVACGLAWFKTTYGIVALVVSVCVSFIGAFLMNHWDKKDADRYDDMGGIL